jgi:hypothetical protein
MKFQSNFMRYSVILRKFAEKAQTTFGAVAKGDLLHFGKHKQKQRLPSVPYGTFPTHFSIIPLSELDINLKNRDDI